MFLKFILIFKISGGGTVPTKFYTPINNVQTTVATSYSISQTGVAVVNGSLFGTPTSGSPTLCTFVVGSESAGTAQYMIREIFGVSGNSLMLGGFIDGTVDINVPAGSSCERRIVKRDFLDIETAITGIQTLSPLNLVTISGSYSQLITDRVILANASGTNINVSLLNVTTLPPAFSFSIKKIDVGSSGVTLTPNGSQKIDGQASLTFYSPYTSYTLITDSANWYII